MTGVTTKTRLRVFIKAFLYFKKKGTTREIADAYNECGFGGSVTAKQVANIIRVDSSRTAGVLNNLKKNDNDEWYMV